VGATESITVGELEDRIASLIPEQRASFGETEDAVRRGFLHGVAIREMLLVVAAHARHLETDPAVMFASDHALSGATVRALRATLGPRSDVSKEDVAKYYQVHIDRYDAPERVQIWRILCKSIEEATAVLGSALSAPTAAKFAELAREHSLDKATRLRSGNLGFLTHDGVSTEPGLRVAPAIVRAATAVHDGELVPAPVREDDYWAVVWRRGSVPPARRSVEEAAPTIRDAVWAAHLKTRTDELIASLRAAKLRDENVALLDAVRLPDSEPP
jgi:peptidyl-prolyl cis-trans isomerase C